MNIEDEILEKNGSADTTYYTIMNSDGKKWSVDASSLKTGFEIYEPSTFKGKLLKKGAMLLHVPPFRKKLNIKVEHFTLCSFLTEILKDIYKVNYSISVFYGTPSTDQKITIQIYKNDDILGYCKVGNSERLYALFAKEYQTLLFLEKQNMKHVPRGVKITKNHNLGVFVQSTEKKVYSKVIHEYGLLHIQFLEELFNATKTVMPFEQTDYYCAIKRLEVSTIPVGKHHESILREIYTTVINKLAGKNVNWGLVHGDFTPWNTCVIDDGLFVFDFEYSLYNGPSAIDMWHFMIQKAIYEDKKDTKEIVSMISSDWKEENMFGLFLYILFYVALYLDRGNEDDIRMIEERLDIVSSIMLIMGRT